MKKNDEIKGALYSTDPISDEEAARWYYRTYPEEAFERIAELEALLELNMKICDAALMLSARDSAARLDLEQRLSAQKKRFHEHGLKEIRRRAEAFTVAVRQFVRETKLTDTRLMVAEIMQMIQMDTNAIKQAGGNWVDLDLKFPRSNAKGKAYAETTIRDKVEEIRKEAR